MSHFVYCMKDYGSVVNYNIAYSKMVYKYHLKIFYNKIKTKEYNS